MTKTTVVLMRNEGLQSVKLYKTILTFIAVKVKLLGF